MNSKASLQARLSSSTTTQSLITEERTRLGALDIPTRLWRARGRSAMRLKPTANRGSDRKSRQSKDCHRCAIWLWYGWKRELIRKRKGTLSVSQARVGHQIERIENAAAVCANQLERVAGPIVQLQRRCVVVVCANPTIVTIRIALTAAIADLVVSGNFPTRRQRAEK